MPTRDEPPNHENAYLDPDAAFDSTIPEVEAIRRRWSRYGGMGNDRSDEDYTDAGCRILLQSAWRDIDTLLALLPAAAGVGENQEAPE